MGSAKLLATIPTCPQTRHLSNGIPVLMEPLPHVHAASASIWIRTGSARETDAMGGISHFIEHLLFKGTERRDARDIMEEVEKRGGHLNAYTAREYTCVYVRALRDHLESSLDVLGDIVQHSTFDDLEKERNVVLEEIVATEDVPEELVHDLLMQALWPTHALGRPIAGSTESMGRISFAESRDYYRQWYQPQHMVCSIAGSFDPDEVHAQLETLLGGRPDGCGASKLDPPERGTGIQIEERDIAQTHICLAFPGPHVVAPDRHTYDMVSNALGGGSTSRLFERIREHEGLAYSVYTFRSSYSSAGMLGAYVAVAPENAERTLDILFEELRRFRDEPLGEDEVTNNREQLKGNLLMALESSSSRMSRMAKSHLYYGRIQPIAEILESVNAVTGDDMQRVAREVLRPDRCVVTSLGPAPKRPLEIRL